MKCISCETEINPKWTHAIEINICPFCGSPIMEEHLKNCITALSSAVTEMLKYPEQLDDWLFSNHSYIKTDSPNLATFLPKGMIASIKKADSTEPKVSVEKIKVPDGNGGFTLEEIVVERSQSEEKTNGFFERAEVLMGAGKTSGKMPKSSDELPPPKSVAEKTQRLKEYAQQIKAEGIKGQNSEMALVTNENIGDVVGVAELQAAFSGEEVLPATGLSAMTGDSGEEIPAIVRNMAAQAVNKSSISKSDKDLQTLLKMQEKVNSGSNKMGKGSFGRI